MPPGNPLIDLGPKPLTRPSNPRIPSPSIVPLHLAVPAWCSYDNRPWLRGSCRPAHPRDSYRTLSGRDRERSFCIWPMLDVLQSANRTSGFGFHLSPRYVTPSNRGHAAPVQPERGGVGAQPSLPRTETRWARRVGERVSREKAKAESLEPKWPRGIP